MCKQFLLIISFLCLCFTSSAQYVDHRFHNVDSLETVMAEWTAQRIQDADEETLKPVAKNIEGLMMGFNQTNGVKSEYYARMLLSLARRFGWLRYEQGSAKNIGQHFWAKERYDSAAFYYNIAMKAVERMPLSEPSDDGEPRYTQENIDDALSQMYGTLGNLYSMMDSIDVAMEYYEKAAVLFKKHDWHISSSILYYNMGETMRFEDDLRRAEPYYKESLKYSLLSGDSLAVATAYKGLGSLYMAMHRTSKAMRYLVDANAYFAAHEEEELQFRMESLDYTGQVLALQKKRLSIIILLLVLLTLMGVSIYFVAMRLRREKVEKKEITEILEQTVEEIQSEPEARNITLKPKERQVLDLIAKGYTNGEIAEAMCLSPETIKWYKKKLFVTFEASNSADLVRIAKDAGLI